MSWNTSPNLSDINNELRTIAKAELHLHAGGAFPPHFLKTIASAQQQLEIDNCLDLLIKGQEYEKGFAAFPLISKVVNTNEKIEKGTIAICESLINDGVTYVEIRSGLKKLDSTEEDYLLALLNALEKVNKNNKNFRGFLLLSVQRGSSLSFVRTTIDLALKYREKGILGIDLSGISTQGDITNILDELKRVKETNLKLTVHLGESWNETNQVLILETLNPDRIGHGVCLTKEAMEFVKKNNTPVEVCLTSAKIVKMHDENEYHPWLLEYKNNGHPIIICTDDPTCFRVDLTDEYALLLNLFTMDEIKILANNSFALSFENNR